MTKFTTANTEDFTAAELAVLNCAYEALIELNLSAEAETVADLVNNAWFQGATADDIVRAVSRQIAA